jgi:hypothetical protein
MHIVTCGTVMVKVSGSVAVGLYDFVMRIMVVERF